LVNLFCIPFYRGYYYLATFYPILRIEDWSALLSVMILSCCCYPTRSNDPLLA